MVTFGNATTLKSFCLRFKDSVPNIHRKLDVREDAVKIYTGEEKRAVLPSAVSSKSSAGIVPERKLSANSSMPKTSKVIRGEVYIWSKMISVSSVFITYVTPRALQAE
jgi:hypothetical protein